MALSAAPRANIFATSHQKSKSSTLWLHLKQNKLLMTFPKRNCHSSWIVRSELGNRQSSINGDEATEPARVLLERLFAQTQKLEKMAEGSCLPMDPAQSGFNLGNFETDLLAALSALKKKEEDLQAAERKILSEQNKINSAKENLVHREQEIASACSKQKEVEEELKLASLSLASQASEIEDLRARIEEREKEICDTGSNLALKEEEINKLQSQLVTMNELVIATGSEFKTKAHRLNEANEVVKRQEVEIQQLREVIQQKENDLEASIKLRELEKEKLKVSEINLGKRTKEWLIAQDELKKLAMEVSKRTAKANAAVEDFRRVKILLNDLRSELVLSQKALASSRKKMEDQDQLLQKELTELEVEKQCVISYMTSLKDAQEEMEREREKHRVAEARNKELEQDLFIKEELLGQLQAELDREKCSLEKVIQEKSVLQEELCQESARLRETQTLLEAKESELVESRLEIQRLKSEYDSLRLILDERDVELSTARETLEDVNKEIVELRTLMTSKEDELTQTETVLKDREEHVQTMQIELDDMKLRSFEAETVVERIVELTNKLVISIHDNYEGLSPLLKNLDNDSRWEKKHLETELVAARESLRAKEMEVAAAQRALAIKDEELKQVRDRLDERDVEIRRTKEETRQYVNDLQQLYSLSQERTGERSMGDLAIEKLQMEATQLEAEAASSALYKLAEMSRELLRKARLSIEAESNIETPLLSGCEVNDECFAQLKMEVSRLSTLTEQLMKEAGIVGNDKVNFVAVE